MGMADEARRAVNARSAAQQSETERQAASEAEFKRIVNAQLPEVYAALTANNCQPHHRKRFRRRGWSVSLIISQDGGDKDAPVGLRIQFWSDGNWTRLGYDGSPVSGWPYSVTPNEGEVRRSFVRFLESEFEIAGRA